MAGLFPAIHDFGTPEQQDVDARTNAGVTTLFAP
jgi:hypothetical protein